MDSAASARGERVDGERVRNERTDDTRTDGGRTDERRKRVILNPTSGSGEHVPQVRRLAEEHGYSVVETERAGHAAELASAATAEDVRVLAACGGDGTVQETIRGLVEADALADVRFGVVPAGTANIFAGDIGIEGIDHAFEVLEDGEIRNLDLGFADGVPFVKSCIAGLTADTSAATTSDMKARFGPLAFVITGVQQAASFEGLDIEVEAVTAEGAQSWSGEALCVLVGNSRRFAKELGQANVEDGLFDVTLIERMPASTAATEAIAQQLLGRDTEHVDRLQARRVVVESQQADQIDFSLDGEIHARDRLDLRVRPAALSVAVGPAYEPDPMS